MARKDDTGIGSEVWEYLATTPERLKDFKAHKLSEEEIKKIEAMVEAEYSTKQ